MRSIASRPDASSIVTSIERQDHRDRDRVRVGGGGAAGELRLLDGQRGADRAEHRARERPGPGSPGSRTRPPAEARGAAASSSARAAIAPWTIAREFCSPSSWKFWPAKLIVPPFRTCWRSVIAIFRTCLETACWTRFSRLWIAWSANWRSSGSLVLRISSTVGLPTPCRDEALDLGDDVAGDDQRGLRLAALDLGDRRLARVDPDRLDRLEQLAGVARRR